MGLPSCPHRRCPCLQSRGTGAAPPRGCLWREKASVLGPRRSTALSIKPRTSIPSLRQANKQVNLLLLSFGGVASRGSACSSIHLTRVLLSDRGAQGTFPSPPQSPSSWDLHQNLLLPLQSCCSPALDTAPHSVCVPGAVYPRGAWL